VTRPNAGEPAGWTWERDDQAQPAVDANWGLERMRVPQMWNLNARADATPAEGHDGVDPRSVHVLDAGFTDHVDLVHLPLCEKHPYARSSDPRDNDHGVAVAGIVGALFDSGVGVDGVNPFARLTTQRFRLDEDTAWNVAELFRPGCPVTPRVVNLSIGFDWLGEADMPGTNPDEEAAAQRIAQDAGRIVRDRLANRRAAGLPVPLFVVAAGNESGSAKIGNVIVDARWGSPFTNAALAQGAPDILVVEALDRAGDGLVRRPTSNLGGHLSAPGGDIWSTLSQRDRASALPGTGHGPDSGTSFAAPLVTGVASFLLTLDPGLTNAQLIQLLTTSAAPVAGAAPMVDAFAAALAIDGLRVDDRIRRALLDVDDGSPDGNTRQDPFTGAAAATDAWRASARSRQAAPSPSRSSATGRCVAGVRAATGSWAWASPPTRSPRPHRSPASRGFAPWRLGLPTRWPSWRTARSSHGAAMTRGSWGTAPR
jgi:subtilisin family serine protease